MKIFIPEKNIILDSKFNFVSHKNYINYKFDSISWRIGEQEPIQKFVIVTNSVVDEFFGINKLVHNLNFGQIKLVESEILTKFILYKVAEYILENKEEDKTDVVEIIFQTLGFAYGNCDVHLTLEEYMKILEIKLGDKIKIISE